MDEEEKLRWATDGLPGDDASLQIGVLISRAGQTPLLIDPQGQVGGSGLIGDVWFKCWSESAGV